MFTTQQKRVQVNHPHQLRCVVEPSLTQHRTPGVLNTKEPIWTAWQKLPASTIHKTIRSERWTRAHCNLSISRCTALIDLCWIKALCLYRANMKSACMEATYLQWDHRCLIQWVPTTGLNWHTGVHGGKTRCAMKLCGIWYVMQT